MKKTKQSAPGEDCISYEIIKHVLQPYLTSLAQLYTKSLMLGTPPDCWKKATIVPIPKKDKGSHRPISLLPIKSKIMEKIMLQRIRLIADPPHTRAMGFKPASGTRDDLLQCQTTNLRCKSLSRLKTGIQTLQQERNYQRTDRRKSLRSVLAWN